MNPRNQHLRREIFSEAQFGEWSGKFSRNFKGKFCQPDREFESNPVRQLVCCFCRENRVAGIIAKCPQVSSGEVATRDRRERSWVSTPALQARNSPFGNSAVRLGRHRAFRLLLV